MFGLTTFNRNAVQRSNNEFANFYNIIDDFFNDSFFTSRSLQSDNFKIDIKENEKDFLIEAELPGVKKEEIKLDYNEGRLLIGVQKNEEVKEEKDNYIHRERKVTSMQRVIYLKNIQSEHIDARLEDGVLKIVAPKLAIEEHKRQIEVK